MSRGYSKRNMKDFLEQTYYVISSLMVTLSAIVAIVALYRSNRALVKQLQQSNESLMKQLQHNTDLQLKQAQETFLKERLPSKKWFVLLTIWMKL